MAEEESESLPALGKIIPEIYYDLIARICAGSPLVVALLWSDHLLKDFNWTKLLFVLAAGYIVGLVLNPFTLPWISLQSGTRELLGVKRGDWKNGNDIADKLNARNKEVGLLLFKMQAEAVLCQVLFAEFVLIWFCQGRLHDKMMELGSTLRWTVLAILFVSAAHRTIIYVYREKRMLAIYPPQTDTTDDTIT